MNRRHVKTNNGEFFKCINDHNSSRTTKHFELCNNVLITTNAALLTKSRIFRLSLKELCKYNRLLFRRIYENTKFNADMQIRLQKKAYINKTNPSYLMRSGTHLYLFGVVKFIVRNTNFGLTDFVVDAMRRHRTRCRLPALLIAKVILALLIMTFVRNGGERAEKKLAILL